MFTSRMVSCLIKEWETLSQHYNIKSPVTIFFGGGTPSLLAVDNVELLISAISASGKAREVSLEANPGDVLGKVETLHQAGVDRLSIGVQALDDDDLRSLNRNHNRAEAVRALEESLEVFPSSTSADLIFGRPGHSVRALREELRSLAGLGLPHLSLYQLTLERGTALYRKVKAGEVTLPGEEEMADLYHSALHCLASLGLERYEVSNFSLAGRECLHNLGYWSGRHYLGLGPGAHSRLGRTEGRLGLVNIPLPERWMAEVERTGYGVGRERKIARRDSLKELLATGLRTRAGVAGADWARLSGGTTQLESLFDRARPLDLGLVLAQGGLRLAEEKISVLDHVLPYLFNCLDEIEIN